MEKIILNADIREKNEKLRILRKWKIIPCITYGRKQEPILLKLNNSDLLRAYRKAWESTIINLKIGKKDIEVVFHQIQKHPVSWDFIHIDFYAITRWEKMTTKISMNFLWESPAKKEGAIIEESLKEIEIKCLPKNLIDSFDVDLSKLKEIWDSIKIKDLNIDKEKYEFSNSLEDVIVSASQPKKIVLEEETEEGTETEEKETEEGIEIEEGKTEKK